MARWQGQVVPAAESLLWNLFDSADDLLVARADDAGNDAIQSRFLDDQRELWRKKDELACLFSNYLASELVDCLEPLSGVDLAGPVSVRLPDGAAGGQGLALETVCALAVERHKELYDALSQRLGVVSGGRPPTFDRLPAGPYQLARVFESAAVALQVEQQLLSVLHGLFEHEVIRQSPSWHHELNESLRDCGVLPDLGHAREPDTAGRGRADGARQYRDDTVAPASHEDAAHVTDGSRSTMHTAERHGHFDEGTIDIVGMLFKVMLNDDRLNNAVKTLLSHLHTPYLKLALRDRSFLEDREHPARQLLANMVEAGSRWVDERDLSAGIYPRLHRIVERVIESGDKSLVLLRELNDDLTAEIGLRVVRQQAREALTVEAEKSKARDDEANAAAMAAIEPFFGKKKTPERYQAFLNGPWIEYMTLLYLRSGGSTDTADWRGAVTLSVRLARCIDALSAGRSPSREELTSLQADLTRSLGDAVPQHVAKVQQLFELFRDGQAISVVAPRYRPAPRQVARVELSAGGVELLERLPKLPSGTWVVFHQDGGDLVVKLSWFNHETERFLFVDQGGAKSLIVPLRELADLIDRERAHVQLATGASYVESSLERALKALEQRS